MTIEFSSPSSFCDSHCARCPVQGQCKLFELMERRRREHELRGEDPDDLEVVMQDVASDMEKALGMLKEELEERGIDAREIEPLPPLSTYAFRLQEVATQHLFAVRGIIDRMGPAHLHGHEDLVEELQRMTHTLAGKVANLSGDISDSGRLELDPGNRSHTVSVLLLLEHAARTSGELMTRLASIAPDLPMTRFKGIQAEFEGLLAPLFDEISANDREALGIFIAVRKAPSPFCTRKGPGGTLDLGE